MRSTNQQRGFTLVELMFSMAFIAILLISITLSIIHITSLYTKGVAMKSINQAGRDLGASLQRDGASVSIVATPIVQPEAGAGLGRLCLGSYSYVWSPANRLEEGTALQYADEATPIIFARTPDVGGKLCTRDPVTNAYQTDVKKEDSSEILPATNGDYALHALTLERAPALGTAVASNAIYIIRYTIGTNDAGSLNGAINTLDRSCRPPDDATNNFNFCSVNTFEIVIRAG